MLLVKTRSETRKEREAAAAAAAKKAAGEERARHALLDEKTTGNEQKRVGASECTTVKDTKGKGKKRAIEERAMEEKKREQGEERVVEDKQGKGKNRAKENDIEVKESVVGTCSPPAAVAASTDSTSVVGTCSPPAAVAASTDSTKTPNNSQVAKVETAAEKYQKQFAFPCGDLAKRRAESSHVSSSEKAKRFRGYSSETEYRSLVPYHMQDGVKRLNKELMGFIDDPPGNVTAAPSDDNLYEWQGIIGGPKETPYEGGVWLLRLRLPEQYPYRPPEVRFVNKIYHCNIDDEGAICLNILKDEWSAAFTIRSLLLSISALMAAPNPDDPLRQDAAQLLKMDKEEHDRIARRYTLQFATGIKAHIPEAKKKSDGPSKSRAHNEAPSSSDGPGSGETSAVEKAKEAAAEPEPNPAREEMFEKARADARNVASAEVVEMQGGLTTLELLTRK